MSWLPPSQAAFAADIPFSHLIFPNPIAAIRTSAALVRAGPRSSGHVVQQKGVASLLGLQSDVLEDVKYPAWAGKPLLSQDLEPVLIYCVYIYIIYFFYCAVNVIYFECTSAVDLDGHQLPIEAPSSQPPPTALDSDTETELDSEAPSAEFVADSPELSPS